MTLIKKLDEWIDKEIRIDKDFLRENDISYELNIICRRQIKD